MSGTCLSPTMDANTALRPVGPLEGACQSPRPPTAHVRRWERRRVGAWHHTAPSDTARYGLSVVRSPLWRTKTTSYQGFRGRAAGIRTRDLCVPKASRPDLGARRRTNLQVRRVRGHHRTGVDDPSRGMGAGWSGSLLRMSRVDLIRREPFGAPLASSPRAARFGLRAGEALEDHRDIDCRDLLAALGPSALAAGMRRMMTRGKGDELRRSCCASRQAG